MFARKVSRILLAVFMLFLFSMSTMAGASTTVKISYNGPANEKDNALHYYVLNFKKMVEERSKGEIKLRLYPDSQLGNEEERMQLMMKSGMNQPIINIASYAGVAPVLPEMYAASIPFMFDSYRAAHIFFDGSEFWKKSQEEFRKRTGSVLLAAIEEGGFLAFTNSKKEIRSPEDFKGLKFRGMDEGQLALYKSFGASGTPIPWTELYLALKTGVVDGQMNPAMYIIIGSLYEVQDYMTLANIQYSDQFLVMNGKLYDSLSPELQKIIVESAYEANVLNRTMIEEEDAKQVKFLEEKGMKVYRPNKEEMKAFRDIGQPAYVDWLKDKVGEEWLNLGLKSAASANKAATK